MPAEYDLPVSYEDIIEIIDLTQGHNDKSNPVQQHYNIIDLVYDTNNNNTHSLNEKDEATNITGKRNVPDTSIDYKKLFNYDNVTDNDDNINCID